jgi:protein-L-isoaspartate(D-aspartate) O-methyltransferase
MGESGHRMDRQRELSIIRAAYAKQVLAVARAENSRMEAAFSEVRREDFLGPGPWQIIDRWAGGYFPTPSADPVYLYTNDLVGIRPEQNLNNGLPSLHAYLIHRTSPAVGERVVHIGTGTGYYTAIFAHLTGASGKVTGIEYEPELAVLAKANLANYRHVEVIQGDGSVASFEEADIIYVNAGCTRPAATWLDRLAEGGRMILPLTADKGVRDANAGAIFLITRRFGVYFATWLGRIAIFHCVGSRDEVSERTLAEAFAKGQPHRVTRLHRRDDIPEDRCWLRGSGWCLAYS